jgi:ABC-type lipoprotein release transport system permease subunit
MIWKLALRHLSRHWRLNLVLLIIMVLGASLLASLPMLAITIAEESLSQSLQSAPVHVLNLIVQGKSKTDELPEDIELSLSDLLKEFIAVREGKIVGFPIILKPGEDDQNLYPATIVLNLRSFDRLNERVLVLEGRLPETDPVPGSSKESPIYEAAIGAEAARRSGIGLGNEVSPAGGSYHLRIVGIVEPLRPTAEVWWDDSQRLPFSVWRRIHISPDIDEWNISLLVPPKTMISKIHHTQYWRLILDHEAITASNAPSIRETLTRLQSNLSEEGMVVRTGLIDLILQFEDALALAQVSLLLLTFQSLLAVFYLLGMFGSFLVEQSRMELATLSGRGFSRSQITGLFARSSILLALLAGTVAPKVASWSLGLWADWQNIPAPDFIPIESRWLALSTGLFSWITLVISAYRSTRRDLLPGQGGGLRFEDRALTKRHPIWDFFILTLGGLAYWQLVQGSTITREVDAFSERSVTGNSDPVLLLGPTLLLLAVGLILIRLLPLLWRLFSWISRQARGLLWTLGFSRLTRQPVGPSQVTLLISLTVGLTFFASVFTTSIENWQQNMARYLVGADIRLNQPLLEPPEANSHVETPGITGITQVMRVEATFLVNEYQRLDFDLLAVDPATFPLVVSYPPGISQYSMGQIMGVLQSDSPNVIPVVISSNATTRHLDIGDQITLEMGGGTYISEVVGIIVNFPLVEDVFAITDLSRFSQMVDLESIALTDQGSREIWMAVDPDEHETVIAKLVQTGLGDSIVGNSQAQLEIFRNNLVFREVTTAFELNAMILIPLSVAGFFLIQLFSTQRREAEFNILQAIGLSKSQLRGLLLFEGFIFVGLGLLVGTGIGFGLATMMQPFLAQILPPLGSDFVLNQMLIDWPEMGVRFVVLLGFYGIGLLVLMISAIRNLRSAYL